MIKPLPPRSQQAWDRFRQQIAEKGGEVLETEWLGSQVPHRCLCAEGHECSPYPGNVNKGVGICRACAGNDPATAWKNFQQRIHELGGEVLESEYLTLIDNEIDNWLGR